MYVQEASFCSFSERVAIWGFSQPNGRIWQVVLYQQLARRVQCKCQTDDCTFGGGGAAVGLWVDFFKPAADCITSSPEQSWACRSS